MNEETLLLFWYAWMTRWLEITDTSQAATSSGILVALALPWFRKMAYEIFIRTHQVLTGLYVYGVLEHLPKDSHFSRLCVYVAIGIFGSTTLLQLIIFLYRNGFFTRRGSPRAVLSYSQGHKNSAERGDTIIGIRVVLPRSVKVKPGQYINVWMPTVSLWSWAQTHPFIVTSWSRGKQDTLDLLVKPRQGLSAKLLRHLRRIEQGSVSFSAFFTGPHGISECVMAYESALVVASGIGIAAVIPYVKEMIYGYNTCTSQIRRLHLVWQIESMGECVS